MYRIHLFVILILSPTLLKGKRLKEMKLSDRNQEIRNAKRGIPNWMIAERLFISEQTLLRWLRVEMKPSQKAQIMAIIQELHSELAGVTK